MNTIPGVDFEFIDLVWVAFVHTSIAVAADTVLAAADIAPVGKVFGIRCLSDYQ